MLKTKNIAIPASDGGSFSAFLAIPEAGSGPGLVILQEIFGVNESLKAVARHFAEEGYTVLVPDLFWRLEPGVNLGYSAPEIQKAVDLYKRFDSALAVEDIMTTADAMIELKECSGGIAVLGFCLGGTLAVLAAADARINAAVAYYPVGVQDMQETPDISCPTVMHFGAEDPMCPPEAIERIQSRYVGNPLVKSYVYPGAGHAFFNRDRPEYRRSAGGISLTRTLELFRKAVGPDYDLSALWDRHTMHEFLSRSADQTIATMVEEPYVNHVPTLTGGIGRRELHHFYKNYFVDVNDESLTITPVSRTVGVDRLVDEMVISFRHVRMMDYLLPGVPPTGRDVKLPMVAVVSFRGNRIFHEHIYWDHASLLAQVGLLDKDVLPISGAEQAEKVLNETSVPSNGMMTTWEAP
jgi:carboxymethylenebutenolidase